MLAHMPFPLVANSWDSLSWVEWVGLVGVVLTLIGLWLTWKHAIVDLGDDPTGYVPPSTR